MAREPHAVDSVTSGDAAAKESEEQLQEVECTICFEAILEETLLPCQCKLHYCLSCWDKALANSFSQCGQARCPSCRSLVRVDFDPVQLRLAFTPETMDMTYARLNELAQNIREDYLRSIDDGRIVGPPSDESFNGFLETHAEYEIYTSMRQMRQGTVDRLRRQAMPAQIQILQRYAEANQALLDIRRNAVGIFMNASLADVENWMRALSLDVQGTGTADKSEMISFLVENTDAANLCCMWASQKCPAPKCVCGSTLQRISGIERFRNSLGERARALSDETIQQHLHQLETQGDSLVICDICEQLVPLCKDLFVWSCENRNATILHATSYDICKACFAAKAWSCTQDFVQD